MRRLLFVAVIVIACAPAAMGQGITGFVGGSEFVIFYGDSTGDVVGFRFQVTAPLEIAMLGVWNADTNAGGAGLTSTHQVGIWDGSQNPVASVVVDPATGTVIGDWTYESVTPVTLTPGQTYTAGVLYTATDNDSYISSATSVTTDPNVQFLNAVFPSEGNLGFVFPTEDSLGSNGRFGPNFTFSVVPVELQSFSVE
ncbi:MAG: DUF4082 domain-containing protein [Thermoanaerobaculales bacterium]|jgi:hypothetical protein|nr:DUF4082 domain-containing protein [Thermoanaerobaculales bacterium]